MVPLVYGSIWPGGYMVVIGHYCHYMTENERFILVIDAVLRGTRPVQMLL